MSAAERPDNVVDLPIPWDAIPVSPRRWLVKGVLPATGVAFMVGASKAGKSFLAIDWACRIAADSVVLNRRTKQAGVVYVAAEDALGCGVRFRAWRADHGDIGGLPLHFYDAPVTLLGLKSLNAFRDKLEISAGAFREYGVELGLLVIDTLSWCIPGVEENSSQDMSRVFQTIAGIARDFNCLALILAHYGKSGDDRGIRGWSGLDAYSDATISVERSLIDPGARSVSLAKVKNDVDGGGGGFRLRSVALEVKDEYGEPITSAVVDYDDEARPRQKGRPAAPIPTSIYVLQAIDTLREQSRYERLPSDRAPARYLAFKLDEVKAEAGRRGLFDPSETLETHRKRWQRAKDDLVAKGLIVVAGELLWAP